MTRIIPQFSKKAVSRAGDILIIANAGSDEYKHAIEVINNWRASHDFPLRVIRNTLSKRAKRIEGAAIVAHRLKRLPSIFSKLQRLKSTRLSGMQDIGGCRVILETVQHVFDLQGVYIEAQSKKPLGTPVLVTTDDYIHEPRSSGYRSLHLTLRYESLAEKCKIFNGHKIEIQMRSRFQHHWATAVETASTFLGEGLKSGEGDLRWLRFFALASSVFAIMENCVPVPNTPERQNDLLSELRNLWYELNVESFLNSCRSVTDRIDEFGDSKDFLLIFNSTERAVDIQGFIEGQNEMAIRALDNAELLYAGRPEIQVVLVTVDSLSTLKDAYPNYNADTGGFLDVLNSVIEPQMGALQKMNWAEGLQALNDEDLQTLSLQDLEEFDQE